MYVGHNPGMTPMPPTGGHDAAAVAPAPDLRPDRPSRLGGPAGNARLTGITAAILLILLAAEGCTLLEVHALITPHVVIGMVLVPFVAAKIATTGWRMVRYYQGSAPYRARGAPHLVLRVLGPVVVVLTLGVFVSGIALLFVPHALRASTLFVHKATFVLWFGAMAIHVLGHLLDTARLAPADFVRSSRTQVRGAGARIWTEATCLVVGIVLALAIAPSVGPWLAGGVGG